MIIWRFRKQYLALQRKGLKKKKSTQAKDKTYIILTIEEEGLQSKKPCLWVIPIWRLNR